MLTDDEATELKALTERFYNPTSPAPLSREEVSRLRRLQGRKQQPAQPDGRTETPSSPAGPSPPPAPAIAPPPRPRRWTSVLVGVFALLAGLGFGWAASTWTTEPPPTDASILPPELLRPATDEDVVDTTIGDMGLENTRFIARVDGIDIYLGATADESLVCIIAVTSAPLSQGCSDWSGGRGGGMASGISSTLTVAIGDSSSLGIEGEPIQLSESVTAFRTN